MKNKKLVWIVATLCLVLVVIVIIGMIFGIGVRKGSKDMTDFEMMGRETLMSYAYDGELEKAKELYEENAITSVKVISDTLLLDKKIALDFEGTVESGTLKRILDILERYQLTATFFIPAIDISEENYITKMILASGHDMQNYTLIGTPHMEKEDSDRVLTDLCRSQEIYSKYLGYKPSIVKFNATELTLPILRQVDASGFEAVVNGKKYLNYTSFNDEQSAKQYVKHLFNGNIVTVKLNGYLDETEYEKKVEPIQDVDFKKAELVSETAKETSKNEVVKSEDERLINVISWLAKAISENDIGTIQVKELMNERKHDYLDQCEALRTKNAGKMLAVEKFVRTTDREAAFVFRDVRDADKVSSVLNMLEQLHIKGTFFVTAKELNENWDTIQKIISSGHQVENGGYTGSYMGEASFETVCQEMYLGQLAFKKRHLETNFYLPSSSKVTDEMLEAASTLNIKLVNYNLSPISQEYVEKGYSAKQIVENYFNKGREVLCRGDILYLDLEILEGKEAASQLIEEIYNKKVLPTAFEDDILQMCSIAELEEHTWTFPADTKETKERIQIGKHPIGEFDELIDKHFIGNQFLILDGFTQKQLNMIDRKGVIPTGQKTIYLTFDDWGDERSIGRILAVLKKHNVKGSFFVKTNFVNEARMNMLRAIAEDGHDVASHTKTHMLVNISEDLVETLQNDLVESNKTLSSVIGDTGRLTNYFRPPTLAINAIGMKTIFDCGYSYIICGDNSTGDYDVANKEELVDKLKKGVKTESGARIPIQDGTIFIMHMSETSLYTADALDEYLTYQEQLPLGSKDKVNFARLSDYLEKDK